MRPHVTDQGFVPLAIAILTVSDSRGEAEDSSGHFLRDSALDDGHQVVTKGDLPRRHLLVAVIRWISSPSTPCCIDRSPYEGRRHSARAKLRF